MRSPRFGLSSLPTLFAAFAIAATILVGTAKTANATYHPGTYQDLYLYYLDGTTYMGYSEITVDYYTWSDGTESVSNMYAALSRSTNAPTITLNWRQPVVINYDGSTAYNTFWVRADCGLGCYWYQQFYQGWFTVQAWYIYGVASYGVVGGADRWSDNMGLYWP